ncbi:MAG TPA: GNAT family N-acetyltransferase [Chloroflexota bacterium]|jgi:GNAT superfamily N-acetyltransferase
MAHEVTTWRDGELAAVVALLNRASAYASFPLDQIAENLADDRGAEPDLRLAVRGGRDPIAAAVGTNRGDVGFVKLLAVDPAHRRAGIGSALLAELERRLAAGGARALRVFADAPHYLRPGVDFRDTPLVSFLERRGFEQRRAVCNMTADLATARLDTEIDEARLAGEGFEVRRLAAADADAFDRYLTERWSASWRAEGMRSLRRQPVSTHLALRDGRIVGFATHSVSGPGQFGPMGTDQELRGRGVGAVLLRRCLADQRAAGLAECDIQWVGPKGFYADHVGARITTCYWQYEKTLVSSSE